MNRPEHIQPWADSGYSAGRVFGLDQYSPRPSRWCGMNAGSNVENAKITGRIYVATRGSRPGTPFLPPDRHLEPALCRTG
jgi:hypothetical protein